MNYEYLSPYLSRSNEEIKHGRSARFHERGGLGATLWVAKNEDLPAVADIDVTAFGNHVGISDAKLGQVFSHGYVLMVRDGNGTPCAEGQLVLNPIPDAEEEGIQGLQPYQGYVEGLANIHPGKKYGSWIIREMETLAKKEGVTEIFTTARAENGDSLDAFTGNGYVIYGQDPDYYDTDDPLLGNRVKLYKPLPVRPGHTYVDPIGDLRLCTSDVVIKNGDTPDLAARAALETEFNKESLGYKVSKHRGSGEFTVHCSDLLWAHYPKLVDHMRSAEGSLQMST